MPKLEEYIKQIIGSAKNFAVDSLEELIQKAKKDRTKFIQKQGKRLEKYIKQLASEKITKAEFKDLVKDLASLEKMEFHKLSAKAKIRAEEISNGITEIVIDGLIKLI